ncbi:AlpA family phage regulatory protein [Burkholderia sp. Bp8986]|nr:AlpA family phage regulatory protein [Burkholderia sp. Bp8986]
MASNGEKLQSLPLVGQSRWSQIEPFIPVCRETWRTMCRQGRAPAPIRLSPRCTVWSNSEIHRWINDPAGYQAPALAA